MKLCDAVRIAKKELPDLQTAAKECIWLYSKHTGKSTASLLANDDTQIALSIFEDFLQKRKKHIPYEYIVNEADFYGYSFFVDERCLIPRPETELLIEKTLEIATQIRASTLLDICTGSGAIACTLKKEMPSLRVTASDISADALDVAQINAKRLSVDIDFLLSDLFSNIKDDNFDILTANPPYIQNGCELDANVLYEPHKALFGGENGAEIVEAAIDGFFERNFKAFICEIGFDQRERLTSKLKTKGQISYGFYRDYAGFDRGFWITKEY